MDLNSFLLGDREVPFEDAAVFHHVLRQTVTPGGDVEVPRMTKEAQMGILKLSFAKGAQGEEGEELRAAMMTNPQVQAALDHQAATAQAQEVTKQLVAQQQQMQQMQQGMQQLAQQNQQMGQQLQAAQGQSAQLQEQLQGETQMRQQSNMQAMQAQDEAIKTKALAQKQRHTLSQLADNMSLQLKQVAATDPVQVQQQQEAIQQQQAMQQQEAAKAQMPARQRKELEQAEKATQQAQVQKYQAEKAMQQGPMAQATQQQANQQRGGMVAQSSRGLGKVDLLRDKLKTSSQSPIVKCSKCGAKVKESELEKHTCGGKVKAGAVPPPTTAMKTRMIEAGMGAGLGAMTGLAYEASRQRFSNRPPTQPSPEEIDLERRNRAAQIKFKDSPTLINRVSATKAQAQLDAERGVRKHPKRAKLRRALQGALVGSVAAPSIAAARRNLNPRIMGR